MISLLIRLVMGKSSNSFWAGLVMLLAGIGLTVGSYVLAASLGGVTLVFYGLIIAGIVRMILSAPTLRTGGYAGYRGSRPYMTGAPGYPTDGPAMLPYGSPTEVDPDHCWLCGGGVKRGAKICLHCGASLGGPQQDSEIAQTAGYSASSSSLVVPPSGRPSSPPPSTWRYQPSAPAPRGPYSPPETAYGPYSSPQPGYGPYQPPQPGYDPYSSPQPGYGQSSSPEPGYGQSSAPTQRRRPRRRQSPPEMPLRIFEAPVRPKRPPREEPYADDSRDWGPPPPRRGRSW